MKKTLVSLVLGLTLAITPVQAKELPDVLERVIDCRFINKDIYVFKVPEGKDIFKLYFLHKTNKPFAVSLDNIINFDILPYDGKFEKELEYIQNNYQLCHMAPKLYEL